ncbi:MAG: hypothetical protein WBN04_11565 [Paracoccaceae bacterium]
MTTRNRNIKLPSGRTVIAFVGVFLLLYLLAFAVAERTISRSGNASAFQKLWAAQGTKADWIVLGASHALPLAYGDVPDLLAEDTGQTMLVLAEVGAGPLYSRFVLDQALSDVQPRALLYVVDSFAFYSASWNEGRVADRSLLRQTPLRVSTMRTLFRLVLTNGVDPRALLDYMTGFSKLNPPDRFPQDGWQGAEGFDRAFRPSRHATASRISYLYPQPPADENLSNYLNVLAGLITKAQTAGLQVQVVKFPIPDSFRDALPNEPEFDRALHETLRALDVPLHDLSAAIVEPKYFFDTDHLNRSGVDELYKSHLLPLLSNDR